MAKAIVGVDIGGTKIKEALYSANAALLDHLTFSTRAEHTWPDTVKKLIDNIKAILIKNKVKVADLGSIGVVAPGPLDIYTGVILNPPNLPGWRNVPLKEILEQEFECPVKLDNDANVGALGELYFGAGKNNDNLVYITISTGIGGGIIIDRKLYRGWNSLAGEVGHFTIDPAGPICRCGQVGCLEAFASGPSLVRQMKEKLKGEPDTIFRKVVPDDLEHFSARDVLKAAREGSSLANEVLEVAIKYLALGISIVNYIVNPEKFILGGGVIQTDRADELIIKPLIKKLQEICRYKPFLTPVVKALLGYDSVIWGCYALAKSAIPSDGEGQDSSLRSGKGDFSRPW